MTKYGSKGSALQTDTATVFIYSCHFWKRLSGPIYLYQKKQLIQKANLCWKFFVDYWYEWLMYIQGAGVSSKYRFNVFERSHWMLSKLSSPSVRDAENIIIPGHWNIPGVVSNLLFCGISLSSIRGNGIFAVWCLYIFLMTLANSKMGIYFCPFWKLSVYPVSPEICDHNPPTPTGIIR